MKVALINLLLFYFGIIHWISC